MELPSSASSSSAPRDGHREPIRIWADGCFDMMHYGHANALRQAKALGDILIVGVHSDAAIEKHKGPTVMKEKERYAAVRAVKWVDEVVEDAPYIVDIACLDKHKIDYVCHGEDISTDAEGNDVYASVKHAGRYKEIKRTDGVSTTDIVGRMLLMTRSTAASSNKTRSNTTKNSMQKLAHVVVRDEEEEEAGEASFSSSSPVSKASDDMCFLPSIRMLRMFSENCKNSPSANDTVVYIDGAFDVFHPGHAMALEAAKAMGDYLIVGVHSDHDVAELKGVNMPILSMYERVLGVLSCRAVDEVVMGAPIVVSSCLIDRLEIDIVAHGTTSDYHEFAPELDLFIEAKKRGIYREFESPFASLSTSSIISRIIQNRLKYEERNNRKAMSAKLQRRLEKEERDEKQL